MSGDGARVLTVGGRLGRAAVDLGLGAEGTAVAGPAAAALVRGIARGALPATLDGRPLRPRRDVALVDAARPMPRWRRVGACLRAAAARGRADLDVVVEALGIGGVWAERAGRLDADEGRRVDLAVGLLRARPLLCVVGSAADGTAVRRAAWTVLRWARDARAQRILYRAPGTRDLEDLADELVVALPDGVFGPGEPWELLGRTWRGAFADEFVVESVLRATVDYLDEEGRWLRVLVGGAEVLLPFAPLSPGWVGRIAVRPESVLVLGTALAGPRATNQLPGTVVAVGDLLGRRRVDVDVGGGAVLRAVVEPETERGLGLEPGQRVVCAFEPAAVRWLG